MSFVCRLCGGTDYVSKPVVVDIMDLDFKYSCLKCGVKFTNPHKFSLPKIKWKKLNEFAKQPTRATDGSIGYDLYTVQSFDLLPNTQYLAKTGISVELPYNTELQIRPRSGMGSKSIIITNSPGTVDTDYRGEIGVLLFNLSNLTHSFNIGDRIAQCIPTIKLPYGWEEQGELCETSRGSNGYGSTGK